jgi:beta-phosphoglucomutase-like phosphatase (HAD superfamily)
VMRSAFLFDLDGTLIDTTAIADIRQRRRWKDCVARLRKTSIFPGISDVLSQIRQAEGRIAVVTTSVSFYAEKALRFHGLPYDALVAFHDVKRPKPAPDGYLRALLLLHVSAGDVLGIGDDAVDADAMRAAQITSVAAGWNPHYHADATWNSIAKKPMDILSI